MFIQSMTAQIAVNRLSDSGDTAASAIAKLSSGNRIVQAADDVAGLAVGTGLQTNVATLRAALTNVSQGSSLLQVADGALGEITDILQRQKALAVQASSGALTNIERGFLDQEFQALTAEIDRLAGTTSFNGVQILSEGGLSLSLAQTDAIADYDPTGADNTSVSVASTKAIEALNTNNNTSAYNAAPSANGQVLFVGSVGLALSNAQLVNVNENIYGAFENFRITDVNAGVSATLHVEINGIEFSGSFGQNDTNVRVTNGSDYIEIGSTALDVTNSSTAAVAEAGLADAYKDIRIARTNIASGISFSGTRLGGVTGDAADEGGVTQMRLYESANSVFIDNFRYIGNGGADSNILTADVNGKVFVANDVLDAHTAGETIVFEDGTGQFFTVNLVGLANDFGQSASDNIRTNATSRQALLDALNTAFERGSTTLGFALSGSQGDVVDLNIGSLDTGRLYGNQTLSVASASSAATASDVLDTALDYLTSIRADVGSIQSRFNYAAANVEVAIQNQDAARAIFLDTDVAATSTEFAFAQVQMQAAVSVIAQANLISQNLLKLIG